MGASLPKARARLDGVAIDMAAMAAEIESALRAVGTPERAEGEKAYLKSDLTFFGTTVWQIRAAVKDAIRGKALDHDQLVELVEALWSEPIHERRMAAVMLLDLHPKLLRAADLPLVERLIRESRTWAYVDALAGDVAGSLLVADPSVEATLDQWAADPDFWVRRSSLLGRAWSAARGRGPRPVPPARRHDAGREGVLRSEGHWLGPARGQQEATGGGG
jgi:hypothetical protein